MKLSHSAIFAEWDKIANEAIRLALYCCRQSGEDFIKIEGRKGFTPYTLCLCKIDKSNLLTFEF
ncbi:MAG: hypothetical protein K2K64_05970 [Muribaculaceae bacterium]|nr:hypothetical protein [Muribaculaceae bacterium]